MPKAVGSRVGGVTKGVGDTASNVTGTRPKGGTQDNAWDTKLTWILRFAGGLGDGVGKLGKGDVVGGLGSAVGGVGKSKMRISGLTRLFLIISPGKGVGSLGSGLWGGVTGGGSKKEDAAQGEAKAEAEQKSSGGFFGWGSRSVAVR
jgi:hypothetical protein